MMRLAFSVVALSVAVAATSGQTDPVQVLPPLISSDAQKNDTADPAVKKDIEALQGVWYHVLRQERGKDLFGEAKDTVVAFRENVAVFKQGAKIIQVLFLKNIDATSTPKKVDFVITDGPNEGSTMFCIYEIKDDGFRYCLGVDMRPTSFATSEADKGYVSCITYKRLKR